MPSRFELELWGKVASQAYLGSGVPLNDAIVKIASDKGLTKDHIERIAQAANSFTNGELIKKAKLEKRDPRIRFDLASAEKIASTLDNKVREPEMKKVASAMALDDLFVIPKNMEMQKVASASALEQAFPMEKLKDPRPGVGEEPEKIAMALINKDKNAGDMLKAASSLTRDRTIGILEVMRNEARHQKGLAKEASSLAQARLDREAEELLLERNHPVHVYGMAKKAGLNDQECGYVNAALMQKIAEHEIDLNQRVPEMPEGIINTKHPLLKAANDLATINGEFSVVDETLKKIADALKTARLSLAGAAA